MHYCLRYGIILFGLALVSHGCTTKRPLFSIENITSQEADGLSGLTSDQNLALWAVQERRHQILKLVPDEQATPPKTFPLNDIPKEIDLESITWLGGKRFALGSELDIDNRQSDKVFIVEIHEQSASIKEDFEIGYEHWPITPSANHGIEGICSAKSNILVGIESVIEENNKRYAPMMIYSMATKEMMPFKIELTTSAGKLAAMACRESNDGSVIELFIIERHFGIGRILRFNITQQDDVSPATIVYDFAKDLDDLPNLEGLAFGANNVLYLISDNNFGRITGPTKLLSLPLGKL